jgi:predicted membrane metal-binding protein
MGILVISAPQLGRRVNFNHVLLISAALMMVYDPRWLMFDLGFQLSFLAIMGLVYFYPGLMCLMEGVLIKAPQRCQKIIRPVAVVLVATVAAQILTAHPFAPRSSSVRAHRWLQFRSSTKRVSASA